MINDISTIQATAVRKAGLDDLSSSSIALAQAFQDDPVFGYCIPDQQRRRRVLPAFFRLIADLLWPYDEVHVAGPATRPVSGAALWVPPGQPAVPESSGEAFEEGLVEMLGEDAERTFEVVALLDEHHPRDDHHYLWFLGVAPERQGEGIGTALLHPVLDRADEQAAPAYLEATSEDNRRLYERHGFVVIDELAVSESPTLWAMCRAPDTAD